MKGYQDLIVWQKSMDLVEEIYRITNEFPKTEIFGLTSQMKRSAVSIPSNIAEGWRRRGVKEKLQFYSVSLGSTSELETQVEISIRTGLVARIDCENIRKNIDEISAILYKIITKVDV